MPYPVSIVPDQCSLGHKGHQERRGQAMHHPPSPHQHKSQVSQPFFKHIFPSDLLCEQQKCQMWERACGGGRRAMGTAAVAERRGKRGGQRESTYRERNTVKSSKFLFILAQQCLQHGLACLLLLNKYCDSSNPSEQGRNQNLDFH